MANWYYYNEQGKKCTVTGGQLKGLAMSGQITPDTIIETEDGKTAPARKVKGLTFAETEQSETNSAVFTLSGITNPPTVPMPTINQPAINQRTNQTVLPNVPVPVAEHSNGSSWQVTIIGVTLILVVGGIGWSVITTLTPPAKQVTVAPVEPPVEPVAPAEPPIVPVQPIEQPKGPLAIEEIIEQVEHSVARIEGPGGSGSGFLVRPQILATNYHVIESLFLEQVEVIFPSATGKEKGPFGAKLLYADAERDIAFLSIESTLQKPHTNRSGYRVLFIYLEKSCTYPF